MPRRYPQRWAARRPAVRENQSAAREPPANWNQTVGWTWMLATLSYVDCAAWAILWTAWFWDAAWFWTAGGALGRRRILGRLGLRRRLVPDRRLVLDRCLRRGRARRPRDLPGGLDIFEQALDLFRQIGDACLSTAPRWSRLEAVARLQGLDYDHPGARCSISVTAGPEVLQQLGPRLQLLELGRRPLWRRGWVRERWLSRKSAIDSCFCDLGAACLIEARPMDFVDEGGRWCGPYAD